MHLPKEDDSDDGKAKKDHNAFGFTTRISGKEERLEKKLLKGLPEREEMNQLVIVNPPPTRRYRKGEDPFIGGTN